MTIRIITVTQKAPQWINTGYQEYAKRLAVPFNLELIEIPVAKRLHNADVLRLTELEGEKILSQIKAQHVVVALDIKGKQWSTEQLAIRLQQWFERSSSIDLLIGGPDGLATKCLHMAYERWSLSLLTFPHQLVRVLIAEQIYRAYSILKQHPYHR